jgi:hypothetical protein
MKSVLATLILAVPLMAQVPAPKADPLAPLRFLVGEWQGEGGGQPGKSSGVANFQFDLEGKILLRRNHAEVAAAHGRPASHHEDLLTIYAEAGQVKAFYLDNEDHIIRYLVACRPDAIAFTSEPAPGPRFRLSYIKKGESLVTVRFEMASPAKPEAFSVYLEADTRRTK